jgi:hypothetical protein
MYKLLHNSHSRYTSDGIYALMENFRDIFLKKKFREIIIFRPQRPAEERGRSHDAAESSSFREQTSG